MVITILISHLLTARKTSTSGSSKVCSYTKIWNFNAKKWLSIFIEKDNELKGDGIENEGNIEYGNDFTKCKNIHKKRFNLRNMGVFSNQGMWLISI